MVQRLFPSIFDMHGGNRPEDPEGFDEDAEFRRAVDLAAGADVAVVVAGEWQSMIGEQASRSSLELPGRQLELLQAVVATGTPTVLLVMNGRPLDLRWAAENVPAILDIWYPGTQGGAAVANLLFGDVSPGGKLPVHLAAHGGPGPDDLLAHPLARAREPGPPLLGRAQHAAVPLRARPQLRPVRLLRPGRRPAAVAAGGTVTVSVQVTNAADRDAPTSSSSTSTSATAPPPAPSASSRASSGSRSRPAPRGRSGSRSAPSTAATGARRRRDWVLDDTVFDVWVGGDSTAQLTTTFTQNRPPDR